MVVGNEAVFPELNEALQECRRFHDFAHRCLMAALIAVWEVLDCNTQTKQPSIGFEYLTSLELRQLADKLNEDLPSLDARLTRSLQMCTLLARELNHLSSIHNKVRRYDCSTSSLLEIMNKEDILLVRRLAARRKSTFPAPLPSGHSGDKRILPSWLEIKRFIEDYPQLPVTDSALAVAPRLTFKSRRDADIWAQRLEGKTLEVIAAGLNITRERVRQLYEDLCKTLPQVNRDLVIKTRFLLIRTCLSHGGWARLVHHSGRCHTESGNPFFEGTLQEVCSFIQNSAGFAISKQTPSPMNLEATELTVVSRRLQERLLVFDRWLSEQEHPTWGQVAHYSHTCRIPTVLAAECFRKLQDCEGGRTIPRSRTLKDRLIGIVEGSPEGVSQMEVAATLDVRKSVVPELAKKAGLHFDRDLRIVLPAERTPEIYGSVIDLVVHFLGSQPDGLTLYELQQRVQDVRMVSPSSILQCKYHEKVGCWPDGRWGLIEQGATPCNYPLIANPPKDYLLYGDQLHFQVIVDKELLRGSGVPVSPFVGSWLNVSRAPTIINFRLGSSGALRFSRQIGGSSISSLRILAEGYGLDLGDRLAIMIDRVQRIASVEPTANKRDSP